MRCMVGRMYSGGDQVAIQHHKFVCDCRRGSDWSKHSCTVRERKLGSMADGLRKWLTSVFLTPYASTKIFSCDSGWSRELGTVCPKKALIARPKLPWDANVLMMLYHAENKSFTIEIISIGVE